ncbi:MAG: DUF11 domain-containing protein, partial [Chloroflexi bacterium]|nr:DUF11 domain-containing protein [Chloroflexota bacterium]
MTDSAHAQAELVDLFVAKSVLTPTVAAGANAAFRITYGNTATVTATSVILTDTLPAGLAFVSAQPLTPTVSGNVLTWDLGTLAPVTAAITVAAQVTAAVAVQTVLTNTAEIQSAEPDGGPDDNVSTQTLTVVPTIVITGVSVLAIEPNTRHLGDGTEPGWTPPGAEGTALNWTFGLGGSPIGDGSLWLELYDVNCQNPISINGSSLGYLPTGSTWAGRTITVPQAYLQSGSNTLRIQMVACGTYDDIMVRNIRLSVPVTRTIVAQTPGYDDEFDAATVDLKWSRAAEDATHWSLTARPGWLRITTQNGDLAHAYNSARNVFLQTAPPGDWSIQTRLEFTPTVAYQHAGLVVYQSDANYLRLTRQKGCDCLEFVADNDDVWTGWSVPYAASAVWLRLDKVGDTYTGLYSADGSRWSVVGSYAKVLSPVRFGLVAANGAGVTPETPADFDYFRVGAPDTPPVATYQPVSLAPVANQALSSLYVNPPLGRVLLGGVPFSVPPAGNNRIQTSGATPITLSTTVASPTVAYVLVNAGAPTPANSRLGAITFTFADGSMHTQDLIIGRTVRDYYQGAYVNTLNDPLAREVWRGSHPSAPNPTVMDLLTVRLPTAQVTGTLTAVTFQRTGPGTDSILISGLTIGSSAAGDGAPDLYTAKTLDPGSSLPGADVTYRIRYGNWSNAPAEGVIVTDTLPAWTTHVASTDTYTRTLAEGVVAWEIGALPPWAAERVLTVTARISETLPADTALTNTVAIAGAIADADPANDVATIVHTPGYGDDFTSEALDAKWTRLREDASHWSLTARPGWLRITSQQGDLAGTYNNARNVFLQTAPAGDWSIQARLEFTPTANYQHAGLVVYQDDANFVRILREFGHAGIEFLSETGNTFSYYYVPWTAGVLWLRLDKVGDTYTGLYSADGSRWTAIGSYTRALSPRQFGLYAASSTYTAAETPADFDYFRVGVPDNPPVVTYQPVSLAPAANQPLSNLYVNPPLGRALLGGVPFFLPPAGNNRIQTSGATPVTLSTTVASPSVAYVLVNAGAPTPANSRLGTITFTFADGSTHAQDLIIGRTVRDWYQGSYVNTLNDPLASQVWLGNSAPHGGSNNARIDLLTIRLPSVQVTGTLAAVTFQRTGPGTDSILISGLTIGSSASAGSADPFVEKSAGVVSLLAGNDVTYRITYGNWSDVPAEGVVITDTLPDGLAHVSSTDTLTRTLGDGTITWEIGSLPPWTTGRVLTVTARLSESLPVDTVLTNTVVVTSATADVDAANSEATAAIAGIAQTRDVYAQTHYLGGNAIAGNPVRFLVKYGNAGNSPAAGVVLTDALGTDLSYVSDTRGGAGVFDGPDGRVITYSLGTLAPGQLGSFVLTVTSTETLSQGARITSTVRIGTDSPESPSVQNGLLGDYFNNTGGLCCGLGDPYAKGSWALSRIDPTINFNWGGGAPASGVAADFGTRWTGYVYAPVTGTYTFSANVDDWVELWVNNQYVLSRGCCGGTSGSIALSGGRWYPIRLDFWDGAWTGYVSLSWQIPGGSTTIIPSSNLAAESPTGAANVAAAGYAVTAQTRDATAQIAFLSSSSGSTAANSDVTFRITYGNTGNSPLANVLITQTIPAEMLYVSSTGAVTRTVGRSEVVWAVPSVAAGGSGTVDVVLRLTPDITTDRVLSTTVQISHDRPEMDPPDDVASTTILAYAPTFDAIAKIGWSSGSAQAGQQAVLWVDYGNRGNNPITGTVITVT